MGRRGAFFFNDHLPDSWLTLKGFDLFQQNVISKTIGLAKFLWTIHGKYSAEIASVAMNYSDAHVGKCSHQSPTAFAKGVWIS